MRPLRNLTIAAMVALTGAVAFAQRGMGPGGPGMYNVTTESRFSGTVDEVQRTQPCEGCAGMGGIHLVVNAESGPVTVHVGPASYVASKDFSFEKGDALVVTGSKVKMGGTDVVLAREISKAGQRLTLRNEQGFPLWSGRMSRP